jgi:predicted Fe-Mo cluster-binding NifX family protein
MKIILTTASPSLDSAVDPRFGRGAYLLVVDTDTLDWQPHPNPGVSAPCGAGIQAAQFVIDQKVGAVLSGDFGPYAFDALQAAGIPMYICDDCRTVLEAIGHLKTGQLQQVGAPRRGDCDRGRYGSS